jgi:hypothetical protein
VTHRHALRALALAVLVSGCTNDPNPSMVEVARSLAPPATTITDVGENTGSRVIVGDYFAIVEIDDGGMGQAGLLEALRLRAESDGWSLVEREEHPFATTLTYERDGLRARITVFFGGPAIQADIVISGD